MNDNNFTYLDDILDLDEPGNENENEPEYSPRGMYSQYSAPPSDMRMSHDVNTIRSSLSTQEMFRSKPDMSSRIQYLPKSSQNNNNRYGQYTEKYSSPPPSYQQQPQDIPQNIPQQQPQNIPQSIPQSIPQQLPVYTGKSEYKLTDSKIQELTDKYEELCYICKKLNDKDSVRYHYIYNIIIIFLFLVILLLIKKVLEI